ncbi:trigger factor family protein, partial [Desulfobulbus sp. N2]|nr:trigger factor family protein [Desulfobulbus sp. N2]
MDVAIEEVSELARKVTVTLPAEDVGKELDKKYNELKKEVALKGFRLNPIFITLLQDRHRCLAPTEAFE